MSGMSSQTTERKPATPLQDMGIRDRAIRLSEGAGGTLTTVAGLSSTSATDLILTTSSDASSTIFVPTGTGSEIMRKEAQLRSHFL